MGRALLPRLCTALLLAGEVSRYASALEVKPLSLPFFSPVALATAGFGATSAATVDAAADDDDDKQDLSSNTRKVTAANAPCNLEPWLAESAALGEEGFHVICALNHTALKVYRGGMKTPEPLLLRVGKSDLRKVLAASLDIKLGIEYNTTKGLLKWRKQPWTLFGQMGRELQVGSETKFLAEHFERLPASPLLLLLFEGGAWRWPTIRVGYRREAMEGVFLTTVSRQPALFEVVIDPTASPSKGKKASKLNAALLSNVVELARPKLQASMTEGKVDKKMRSSEQTFLDYGMDPKLKELALATSRLLRGPEENLEALQVLRYTESQHYDAHRDYWDPREFPDVPRFKNQEGYWHMRHATLLWYLSPPDEGGETWFPRAHGGPIPTGDWMACDDRGAKVSPRNATAVLFYSLRADGDIDEYSWHCGCPVKKGVKWAANSWISNTPKGIRAEGRRPETPPKGVRKSGKRPADGGQQEHFETKEL